MQNPFDWDYLTAPINKTPAWGVLSVIYLVIFGLGFIASILAYNDVGGRLRRNRLLYSTLRQASGVAMVIFGIGLAFFAFRMMRVSAWNLHMRIWLYLTFLAFLALVGYYAYYFRAIYPLKRRALEAQRQKRKYLAPAASSPVRGAAARRQAQQGQGQAQAANPRKSRSRSNKRRHARSGSGRQP
jgi:hypothetical protein